MILCNSFTNLSLLFLQEIDTLANRLTFCCSTSPSHTLEEPGSISVESTFSEVISGPSVLILYINQPPKLRGLFFSSNFHFQAEQTVLSFLPFFPHSSIRVIALSPGIERSCHNLSRTRWLKCPSGDHSNTVEFGLFLNSLGGCSHLGFGTHVHFSVPELTTK